MQGGKEKALKEIELGQKKVTQSPPYGFKTGLGKEKQTFLAGGIVRLIKNLTSILKTFAIN